MPSHGLFHLLWLEERGGRDLYDLRRSRGHVGDGWHGSCPCFSPVHLEAITARRQIGWGTLQLLSMCPFWRHVRGASVTPFSLLVVINGVRTSVLQELGSKAIQKTSTDSQSILVVSNQQCCVFPDLAQTLLYHVYRLLSKRNMSVALSALTRVVVTKSSG
jgi:hypothetical protein